MLVLVDRSFVHLVRSIHGRNVIVWLGRAERIPELKFTAGMAVYVVLELF